MNFSTILAIILGISLISAPLTQGFLAKKNPVFSARLAGYLIGSSLIMSILLLICSSADSHPIGENLFDLSRMNLVLSTLICWVSFVIHRYSLRYFDGDRKFTRHFNLISLLTLSAVIMVLANHLLLLSLAWFFSNLFLALLMIHKKEWQAAQSAGQFAFFTLTLGSLALLAATFIFYFSVHSFSLAEIINSQHTTWHYWSLALISLSALLQSAIWPFHRWLLSSLNSPTPVSALMHAGLINGGGVIVIKCAPLIICYPSLLYAIFLLGALSALIGTFWKLIQSDVKRMLSCSTFAQMGFMMMQCGLGLFGAALAHLCWHGLFKAYLFLNSGSSLFTKNENKMPKNLPLSAYVFILIGGVMGVVCFSWVIDKPLFSLETSSFLLLFAFVTAAQIMLTFLSYSFSLRQVAFGIVFTLLASILYGESIHLFESLTPHLRQQASINLSAIHLLVLIPFFFLWIAFNFGLIKKIQNSKIWCWFYVNLLNSSQPKSNTITAIRTDYHY